MNLLNSPPINIKIEFANLPDDITYKLILLWCRLFKTNRF